MLVNFEVLSHAINKLKALINGKANAAHKHAPADINETADKSFISQTDKEKVSKIITTGYGNSVLYDDGSYKEIGISAPILDETISKESTYSSDLIESKLGEKAKATDLHSHKNKSILDTINSTNVDKWNTASNAIVTTGAGDKVLHNDGTFKEITGISSQIDDTKLAATDTTLSAAKIASEIDLKTKNKVSTVEGKGLSTNDFTNVDKSKVNSIITNGSGDQILHDDGTYKPINNAGINDEMISSTTTYSSEKTENRLTEVENAIAAGSGAATMWQKTYLNVKAGDTLYINTTDDFVMDKVIVQAYKFVPGKENIVETIKTFDNSDAENFYYNPEHIEFNGAMRIRDSYPLTTSLNADGFYETEIIDKSKFVDIGGIEVI